MEIIIIIQLNNDASADGIVQWGRVVDNLELTCENVLQRCVRRRLLRAGNM